MNVAVPKTRGGRIDDSEVCCSFSREYGIGFCCVGNVEAVVECSVGVDVMARSLCPAKARRKISVGGGDKWTIVEVVYYDSKKVLATYC